VRISADIICGGEGEGARENRGKHERKGRKGKR
jgi:hypothetical protein